MQTLLPGWMTALNHHPAFVHFPLVLWLTALLLAVVAALRADDRLRQCAYGLLYLGTLAGVAAVLTGLNAERSVPPGPVREVLETHEELMLSSLALAAGLSLFVYFAERRPTLWLRRIVLIGLVVLAVLVLLGADRGAEMVYRYGVSVNWSTALPRP
jgi:uncharacterized membrane protein